MNRLSIVSTCLRQTALVLAVLAVGIISILGTITFPTPYQKFGNFFVTTNAMGIGIYQPAKYADYEISPFLDVLSEATGAATPVAALPGHAPTKTLFTSIQNKMNSVLQYFSLGKLTFRTGSSAYSASVAGDTLTIHISIKPTQTITNNMMFTMIFPYNRDDIVFDSQGVLYSETSDETVAVFTKAYAVPLHRDPVQYRVSQSRAPTLYIVNPWVAGVLAIRIPSEVTVDVDKDNKHILIHEYAGSQSRGRITKDISIETFSNAGFIGRL
jgi:hypothetical protein